MCNHPEGPKQKYKSWMGIELGCTIKETLRTSEITKEGKYTKTQKNDETKQQTRLTIQQEEINKKILAKTKEIEEIPKQNQEIQEHQKILE